jgi:hypothetical protein
MHLCLRCKHAAPFPHLREEQDAVARLLHLGQDAVQQLELPAGADALLGVVRQHLHLVQEQVRVVAALAQLHRGVHQAAALAWEKREMQGCGSRYCFVGREGTGGVKLVNLRPLKEESTRVRC